MSFAQVKEYAQGIHIWLTIVISIGAVVAAAGFTLSPPWAKAEDLRTVQTQVETLLSRQKKTDTLALTTQKLMLQAQLREAEKDLSENPRSWSAQRLAQQLRDQIAEIDRALAQP